MSLELHFKIVGALMFFLASIHVFLPRRFDWPNELRRLSLLNRQIFVVHCSFIVLLLLLLGTLSLVYTPALLEPTLLARHVLAGLTIFWGARLVTQLFIYDSRLWRGNRFNTIVHVLFTTIWTYYTAVFACGWWRQIV
jgi:hypothetical protein